jgi:hypothetical protein
MLPPEGQPNENVVFRGTIFAGLYTARALCDQLFGVEGKAFS